MIEVRTQRRDQLATIAEGLARLDYGRAQIDEATCRVTVGIDSAGDGLRAAVSALDAAGIEIEDIALRQPTLDEVFLALTGRSAADHEEPIAARRGGRGLNRRRRLIP